MKSLPNRINLLSIRFLSSILVFGQFVLTAPAQSKERLRLIGADRLEQVSREGLNFKKLTGNVHFRKGEVDLTCELAYWFEKQEQADFYRNVQVTKKNQILQADTLTYFADRDIIIAHGRTRFTDGEVTLTSAKLTHFVDRDISEAYGKVYLWDENRDVNADSITYYSETKKAVALSRAVIHDRKRFISLFGDSLVYFNETGDIEATRHPFIVKKDSTGKETFRIKGEIIKRFEESGYFTARRNVKLWQDDFSSYCDVVDYYDSLEVATMSGKPIVYRESQKLVGEQMKMQLQDEELQSLFIYDNAVASSHSKAYLPYNKSDSAAVAERDSVQTYDELTGKLMEIYFQGGQTDSIRVSGMATSYYNVTEDSIIQGVNVASGDTVIMKFLGKRLNRITVIGGTEGKFIPDETNTSTDTTVLYSAERIDYYLEDKITNLYQKSEIKSGDMELKAGKISVKWDENLLYAYPLGSPPYDSTEGNKPTLYQHGREPFSGAEMIYNMKTQKGRIVEGRTKEQDGYYTGENIAKVTKTDFYVTNGVYTTCDLEEPHYYFRSRRMKLIQKDKIIARPIVLYIHDIPLLALPFGIFPNKGGRRHSGWIMPTYGESGTAGGYIRGLGYFWAPNDYYDIRLTTNFYDKRGTIFQYRTRYNKRYVFSGSISGSYTNEFLTDFQKRQWTLNINHSHKLSPTMQLRANGSFVSSDDLYQKLGISQNTRLNQQLISNATLSKTWPDKPYSMSMTFNQTVNLQAKTLIATDPTQVGQKISYIKRSLPNISFNRGTKPLIPARAGVSASKTRWYNNIYFGISSQYLNNQDIYYQGNDSLLWERQDQTKNAVIHNISLNSSQKVFSYITLNQNMSIQEGWIFDYLQPRYSGEQFVIDNNKIVTQSVSGFKARHTGSMSLNAQTKIYGMFPARIGALRAIRHVVSPQIGLSYRPDFSQKILGWDPGYIQTWEDSTGKIWKHDYFSNTLLGSTPAGESRAMTLRLNNLFQAKTKVGDQENKVDFLNLDFGTSYNFAADSLRWAPISTSIRTQLSKKLVLNISASYDLYKYRNGRVNEWNEQKYGIPIPRLTSVSATTGFSLSGRRFGVQMPGEATADTSDVEDEILGTVDTEEDIGESPPVPTAGAELWSGSMSFRYNYNRPNPAVKSESFFMSTSLKLNLSSKWAISWQGSFDLLAKKINSQSFTITRDLHCWQLTFNWTPSKYSYAQQYNLTINVKSPTLRDLKYEEKGGRRSTYGF